MECRSAKAVHLYQIPWLTSLSAKQLRTRMMVSTCDRRATWFDRAIELGRPPLRVRLPPVKPTRRAPRAGMAFCLGRMIGSRRWINRSLGRHDGVDSHISTNLRLPPHALKLLLALLHGQELPPSVLRFVQAGPCAAHALSPLWGVVAGRLVDGHSFELMLPPADR